MADLHSSSFGAYDASDARQLPHSDPTPLQLTVISPSHLNRNQPFTGDLFFPMPRPTIRTHVRLPSPKAALPDSFGRKLPNSKPLTLAQTQTEHNMDFGGLEQIPNVQAHELEQSPAGSVIHSHPNLNLAEEPGAALESEESLSGTERSLINSLLTKEDGMEFYERNSSYENSQPRRSQPGSERDIAEHVARAIPRPSLMPEIEEVASSAVASDRPEENENDKTMTASKFDNFDQGPKLRLSYDRASIYGPDDYTYYLPREIRHRGQYEDTASRHLGTSSFGASRASTEAAIRLLSEGLMLTRRLRYY